MGYTAIELSLVGGMIWVAGDGMGHDVDGSWSGSERDAMIGLVAGYVVAKLVAGLDAGRAARRYNVAHEPKGVTLSPTSDGVAALWSSLW